MKSISTTISKAKSIAMLTLKTSNFQHAHKNKFNFDSRTKNKSISVLTLKSSQFLSPTRNQTKFDPNTEVELTSYTKKKENFHVPRHENHVYFSAGPKPSHILPPNKTVSIRIPTLKSSQLRLPTLKSRPFQPPTQHPSRFRCQP